MKALSRQQYAMAAAAVFGMAGLNEVLRVSTRRPWPNFATWWSNGMSVFFAALWFAAAATLIARRRSVGAVTASWNLGIFGVLGLVCAALVLMAMHAPLAGFAYLAAAAIAGFFFKRSFDRGLLDHALDLTPRLV